ncbi:MAG: MarR family transcriptional regulator [Caldiserica bacterium]|nr:MarR family transcriptional regulator [Caldisericota bacterium]
MEKEILPIKMEITQDSTVQDIMNDLMREMLDCMHFGLGSMVLSLLGKDASLKEIKGLLKGFETSKATEISATIFSFVNISKRSEKTFKGAQDFNSLLNYLKGVTEFMPNRIKTIMLLIDEGEYVAKDNSANLLQSMRLLFQTSPFMVIIAGSPVLFDKLASIEPSFGNLFPEQNRIILKLLEIDDIKQLIIKRLDLIKKDLKGTIAPFTDDSLRVILEYSAGNPRYIIRISSLSILKALEAEQITSEHAKKASKEILSTMGRERFQRLESNDQNLLIKIGKMTAPSVTELARELSLDEATISRRLNQLEELGYVRSTRDGRKRIAILEEPVKTFIESIT